MGKSRMKMDTVILVISPTTDKETTSLYVGISLVIWSMFANNIATVVCAFPFSVPCYMKQIIEKRFHSHIVRIDV